MSTLDLPSISGYNDENCNIADGKKHVDSLNVKHRSENIDVKHVTSTHLLSNESCIAVNDKSKPIVKGSLKKNFQFWIDIGANDYILNVINSGYKLPFKRIPEPAFINNNKSARYNEEFVKLAIMDLVRSGSVIETKSKPLVVNPLTVAQNTSKKRLVLDLRHINQCLEIDRIKFEDWKTALLYANQGKYMFSFDLTSGYHHIEINKEFQQYLGFAWKFGNELKFFYFTVLPFGLATAGHIFTKTVRCLVKHWRSSAIEIVVYLDDGLGFGSTYEEALIISKRVKLDLHKAGLIENEKKSIWEPIQRLIW